MEETLCYLDLKSRVELFERVRHTPFVGDDVRATQEILKFAEKLYNLVSEREKRIQQATKEKQK